VVVRWVRCFEDTDESARVSACDLDAARAFRWCLAFRCNVTVLPPRVVEARTVSFDPVCAVFLPVRVVAARGVVERLSGDAVGVVGDTTASGAAAAAGSVGAAVVPGGGGAVGVVTAGVVVVGVVTVGVVVVGVVTVGVVVVGVVVVGVVTVGVVVVGVVVVGVVTVGVVVVGVVVVGVVS
jgi:hypothetical protein